MSIVVSCPKCERKLKVAETSLGRSVKCPCGNVFKAHETGDAAAPPKPAAAEMLVVACAECGTKLKVPTSAQGKKMKCAKCGATFVVGDGQPPIPPPVKPAPVPPSPPLFEDEPQ